MNVPISDALRNQANPAVTMRRLANSLGVQATSLYSHYDKKEEVLDPVANLHPHLGQAYRLRANAERIDRDSFNLGNLHPNGQLLTAQARGFRLGGQGKTGVHRAIGALRGRSGLAGPAGTGAAGAVFAHSNT